MESSHQNEGISGHEFIFLDDIEKIKKHSGQVLNTFENMENGAFAPKEQIPHFPYYFQMHAISKASRGAYME